MTNPVRENNAKDGSNHPPYLHCPKTIVFCLFFMQLLSVTS